MGYAPSYQFLNSSFILQYRLDKFIETYHKRIGQAYVIHTKNLMKKDNVICIPSYMTFCLQISLQ